MLEWTSFFYHGLPLPQGRFTPFPPIQYCYHLCACVFCCSVISNSLQPNGLEPTGLFCPWKFPGKNTAQWIVAHRALLSMEISRQEYWSKLPLPPPGDLPDRIKLTSPVSLILADRFFPAKPPGKPCKMISLKTLSLLFFFSPPEVFFSSFTHLAYINQEFTLL